MDVIPTTQKQVIMNTWYQLLRELWLMAIALPGTIGLFIQIHEYLHHFMGKRMMLTRGIQDDQADFLWIT